MTTFDWALIYPIGDELIQTDDEAHLRSAFGRYYYSPYCCARFYLVDIGHYEFLSNIGGHKNLYNELQNSPDANEKELGKLLEKLFAKRVEADYLVEKGGKNLDLKYFQRELPNVQKRSKKAMKIISILKNNPPRHRFKF